VSRKPNGYIPDSFTPDHYFDMKYHGFRDREIAEYLDVTPNTLQIWKRVYRLTGLTIPREDYIEKAINDLTVDEYFRMKDEGMTDEYIAYDVLFVHPTTLHEWKRERGMIRKLKQNRPKKVTHIKDVIAAHKSGVSQRKIADRFGVTKSTIHRIIKKYKEETNDHYTVVRPIRQFSRR
jgi:transposase